MLFRRSTLPLGKDSSARFLPWLIAFMVFLACLALAAVLTVERSIARWDRGLSGQLTVQVPAADDPVLDETRLQAVLAVLTSTAGVRGVSVMNAAEVRRLLQPWLGSGTELEGLPLPALIAVTVDPVEVPDLDALNARLAAAVPGSFADNHQRWLDDLLALAGSVELAAIAVMLLVGLAAIITVVFVTRTGLEIHRQVIELLHLMGAQDRYIAREFQRHALRLGLRGGLFGFALAAAALAGLARLARGSSAALLPDLDLTPIDWAWLALLPLAAAATAMWTARLTVLRTLVRLA
jgi:cell division transport system permease protein